MKRLLSLLSAVACVTALLVSERPRRLTAAPEPTCSWTPSGTVNIAIGAIQTFTSSGGCSGYAVDITPTTGIAGFSSGTDCDLTSVTTTSTGLFKVRGCVAGSATVTIRNGGAVVQTIGVVVAS